MIRRDFYRYGTMILGGVITAVLAIPGVAYVLDPLGKKRNAVQSFRLARLSELQVNVPRSFQIIDERQDAWVKYPKEPVGLVWLVRNADDSVTAFQAECPHLGCAISLSADAKSFRCPCHDSAFSFSGTPQNQIPPRPMDSLIVKKSGDTDPDISVTFERFRAQAEEKIPLV